MWGLKTLSVTSLAGLASGVRLGDDLAWGSSCTDVDTREQATADGCGTCLSYSKQKRLNCKYCPLSRTCTTRGGMFHGGSGCLERAGHEEDQKVSEMSQCRTAPNPIRAFYTENYHPDAYADPRYKDVRRCIRYSLGMEDEEAAAPGGSEAESYEDRARWGCKSTLVRETIAKSMIGPGGPRHSSKTRPRGLSVQGTAGGSLLQEVALSNASEAVGEDMEGTPLKFDWPGKINDYPSATCDIIQLKLKGKCYERGYAEEDFRQLRDNSTQPNGIGWSTNIEARVLQAIESGPLISFSPGAGKSGSVIGMTADHKFIVKIGLRHDVAVDEPAVLKGMIEGTGKRQKLAEFMWATPENLLNRIYTMGKISLDDDRQYYVILQNAAYNMDRMKNFVEAKYGYKIDHRKYDLKGKSRSQKKRSEDGASTGINGDFAAKEGMLLLSSEQCMKFRQAVFKSTAFLETYNLIDYGFFINIFDQSGLPKSVPRMDCSSTAGEPFCFQNGDELVTISIIDYLNEITVGKNVESIVHGGKFWWYAFKVNMYAIHICPTESEKQLRPAIAKCKGQVSTAKAFKMLDQDRNGKLSAGEYKMFFTRCGLPQEQVKLFMNEAQHVFDHTVDKTINEDAFEVLMGEY
eukprot:TRINITY_DN9099_c0_g1_i1.p1 TRINITY_DN9099_c0_g1~~TRINITY_DN9099_c0_g1_i1.p1  ORF type:complete len:632 (+),score=111.85 TRINITY_DN9099_c0_g1_i1:87-1982(+)